METRRKILIIDDESDIAVLLRQVLLDAEFDADIALGGREGLDKAAAAPYDLILLDMRMPGIDGMEVLRRLRDNNNHIPVIFITGSVLDVDEVVAALDLNPSDFITKVVSPKELIARIRWTFKKQQTS